MSLIQAKLFEFNEYNLHEIINVAAVPQRSIFRYPGGKTWLVPRIRKWIKSLENKPKILLEPFAGGGIVGLTAAAESLVDQVILVELDEDVSAVWQTIIYGDAEWLANRILNFQLSTEAVEKVLSQENITEAERAFRTILRNRVSHGGILAPGAGQLKNGEKGKGIASRWYPETLKKRIMNIMNYREKITFIQGDGIKILKDYSTDIDAIAFIDPPYTSIGKRAGTRLYNHFELDHELLFQTRQSFSGDILITYENSKGVQQMADQYGFEHKPVAMSNTHHTKMEELLIGKNLLWA